MQENGNNIDVAGNINPSIGFRSYKQLEEFKSSIQKELTDVENKIAQEIENIGISETSLIERGIKYEKSLGVKILMGFHYCTF